MRPGKAYMHMHAPSILIQLQSLHTCEISQGCFLELWYSKMNGFNVVFFKVGNHWI
jgi:hypothetical protein